MKNLACWGETATASAHLPVWQSPIDTGNVESLKHERGRSGAGLRGQSPRIPLYLAHSAKPDLTLVTSEA